MPTEPAHLVFVMTGAGALTGGIATANLNILAALVDLVGQRALSMQVLSYLETDADRPDILPPDVSFRGFAGKKASLIGALVCSAVRRPVMFFDHVTLALPVLPFASSGLVKTIIFAHGSEAWRHIRRTSRWSFRVAPLTLANSHFTLTKMRERISQFNGVACPLGLSPRFQLNDKIRAAQEDYLEFASADGQMRALGHQVLLMVARMHPAEPRKGHLALLNVWPAVAKEFPEAQLVFAGQGENKPKLEELARKSGAGSSIFLLGSVSVELLEKLYRRCYGFVMPSKQEGFGLVYLEAMNFGKPCVGCFDDGAQDVIVHDETGLLVNDPNNTEELLGVLRTLLNDPERARRMGAEGFERLHENFTSQHVQERIKEHVRTILS